jgi:hypothetical protein
MFDEIQQASFKTINENNNVLRNSCAMDKIISYKVMNIQANRTEVRSQWILSLCNSDFSAARVLKPLPHK